MKAAIVKTAGKAPEYGDFEAPRASAGCREIRVAASALSHVTRSRAAGVHYTSDTAGQGLPFVAGVDGTGVDADGRRVYFFGPVAPHGAMAERTLVSDAHCLPLPDALDDVTAAALAIPAMSSWAALKERARLEFGETVLVNGATGSSGRLAVQIAKYLGAGKVIATGRDATALGELSALGADVLVPLGQDETLGEALREQFAGGVDIVLDYLWGPSAHALLGAAARALPDLAALRYVQIGAIGGGEISLPAAVLRSTAITLMGSGMGSVPMPMLLEALRMVLDIAPRAGLRIDTRAVPLAQLGEVWAKANSRTRTVFTIGA
ncbi:quinone oxidoreductase family protein [Burkholderia gladioli]|uniref:quinone oxidoreductase family protein n=1 Tax=Burkholderia gladioli TaxID=28095 RepID=UPI001640E53B|nr:zinc-binding alcohol dehydrogenase family protein [Burkholderia gladioli]